MSTGDYGSNINIAVVSIDEDGESTILDKDFVSYLSGGYFYK